MKGLQVIVACTAKEWGIGYNGDIPWKAPTDLKHFKKVTTSSEEGKMNALIMGRVTFDEIKKPLPERWNYVITGQEKSSQEPNLTFCNTLTQAITNARENPAIDKIFIVGGESIYTQTFREYLPSIEHVYMTLVYTDAVCDRYFKYFSITEFPNYFCEDTVRLATEKDGLKLTFVTYKPCNREELQYLNLIQQVIDSGDPRVDRTGVGTLALFGEKMTFDISKRIPLLTTKRVAWKTMLRELLWFISGDTNAKTLQAQGVRIWDGNSSREYLDSIGLTEREEGDLGPVYGYQWRHFGAEYVDCHTDYTGKGVDQLQTVIDLIKNDPTSRRIIFSAWNPAALKDMALPPCHLLCQFFVRESDSVREKYLDCQMYQRSCDMGLGVPFNIASYSMLTYMIAHVTGLKPGRFIHVMGDTHVYKNHIKALKEQLIRTPFAFPRLEFSRKVDSLFDFKESDFIIHDYRCHPTIKMDMAV